MKKILFILLGTSLLNCSQSTEEQKNSDTNIDVNLNEQPKQQATMNNSIYNFSYETPSGEEKFMKQFEGKVILIVNTATQCGLTPQFEGLEKLHETYEHKGLKVIGFPCNQFGGQEPLSNKEMVATCKLNHGVNFELTKKIEVNGENENGLYTFLKSAQKIEDENDIRWNFEKFIVNRQGQVVKRFSPKTTPAEITQELENLL